MSTFIYIIKMITCQYLNCISKVDFLCSCTNPPFNVCASHCGNHMSQDISKVHSMSSIYSSVDSNDIAKVKNWLESHLNKLRLFKSELVQSISYLNKLAFSVVSKIIKFEKMFKDNLTEVLEKKRFLSYSEFGIIKSEKIKVEELKELDFQFYNDLIKVEDAPKILFSKKLIEGVCEKMSQNYYHQASDIDYNHAQFPQNYSYQASVIYYSLETNKNLMIFNPSTLKITQMPINSFEVSRWGSSIVPFSPDKLFIYGGCKNHYYLDDTYIIDLNQQSIEVLPVDIKRRQSTGEHFNNKIYVFGGYGGSNLVYSSFFDLIQKNWVRISDMPLKSRNISTLSINSKILITGYYSSLFLYDPAMDSYDKTIMNFEISSQNILFRYGNRIILVNLDKIYFADCSDIGNFEYVSNRTSFTTVSSKPVIDLKKKLAYFVDYEGDAFMVHCETLKVSKIT